MLRRLLPVLAVVALAVGASAQASANTTLSLTGFGHMVVDSAHGHVFVSGSSSDSQIAVMNTDGTLDEMLTVGTGARGLALDSATNTLYVARCGAGEIDEVDTATLTVTGSFASSVYGTCDMVLAANRLWYSNSTDGQFGDLVSVSLDSSHTEVDSHVSLYGMVFAADPSNPDRFAVGTKGQSPSWIDYEEGDSAGNVTELGELRNAADVENLRSMAITPDGSKIMTAAGGNAEIDSFDLPSFTADTVYPTTNYPAAMAVSPDGTHLAEAVQSFGGTDLWVFPTGSTTTSNTTSFGSSTYVQYGGAAFSADGKSVYVVTAGGPTSGTPTFRVVPTVKPVLGSLTLKRSKATITNGQGVTLTAHLGTSTSVKTVTIYRKVAGTSTWVAAHTGNVGASGNMTFVAKPTMTTSYQARWAGDATHALTTSTAAAVGVKLVVHTGYQGGYSTRAGVRLYHFTTKCEKAPHTGCPKFVAYGAPIAAQHKISLTVQARVGGAWHTVIKGSTLTGAGGKLLETIFYTNKGFVGIPQRIQFSIPKTATNLGNVSAWRPFRITS